VKFKGHPRLEKLDLKKNKLRILSGLKDVPNLHMLDVSNNKIIEFGDISAMPALKNFFLKANRFK